MMGLEKRDKVTGSARRIDFRGSRDNHVNPQTLRDAGGRRLLGKHYQTLRGDLRPGEALVFACVVGVISWEAVEVPTPDVFDAFIEYIRVRESTGSLMFEWAFWAVPVALLPAKEMSAHVIYWDEDGRVEVTTAD